MKPTILFMLLTTAIFTSCKKDNSTVLNGDYISFRADGALRTVNGCEGHYFKFPTGNSYRVVIIGRTDKNEQMIFDVRGTLDSQLSGSYTEGYYAVPMGGIDSARYKNNTLGVIKLQSLTNDRVTGTFQFTATSNTGPYTGTKNITDGSFGCKVVIVN